MRDGTGDLVLDRIIGRLNELKRERDQCRHITEDTKELDKGLKELLNAIAKREWLMSEGYPPPTEQFGRPGLPPPLQATPEDDYAEDSEP
jgi:hypothetical protein